MKRYWNVFFSFRQLASPTWEIGTIKDFMFLLIIKEGKRNIVVTHAFQSKDACPRMLSDEKCITVGSIIRQFTCLLSRGVQARPLLLSIPKPTILILWKGSTVLCQEIRCCRHSAPLQKDCYNWCPLNKWRENRTHNPRR